MRFLAVIGALAILLAIASAVYFFAGFYDVAASGGGNAAVDWAVGHVREASVGRHASAPPRPDWFGKPEAIQAGAREFAEEGCVRCHGAPGADYEKFAEGMHPTPPDLGDAGQGMSPEQIFWVVKNGIRMTGMPAFGDHAKDDEIWRAVAFVKQMKSVTPDQFTQWTAGSKDEGKSDDGNSKNGTPSGP